MGVAGAALSTVVSQGVSVALCLAFVRRRVPVLHVHREDWRVSAGRAASPPAARPADGVPGVDHRDRHARRAGAAERAGLRRGRRVHDGRPGRRARGRAAGVPRASRCRCSSRRTSAAAGRTGSGAGVVQGMWLSVARLAGPRRRARHRRRPRSSGCSSARARSASSTMAAHFLLVNGVLYVVLGVLFVLRGALQGLGQTVVPTLTGVIELICRVGAAGVLGAAYGYDGVVWGNPLAWIGAVVLLVPAYARAPDPRAPACHRAAESRRTGRCTACAERLRPAATDDPPVAHQGFGQGRQATSAVSLSADPLARSVLVVVALVQHVVVLAVHEIHVVTVLHGVVPAPRAVLVVVRPVHRMDVRVVLVYVSLVGVVHVAVVEVVHMPLVLDRGVSAVRSVLVPVLLVRLVVSGRSHRVHPPPRSRSAHRRSAPSDRRCDSAATPTAHRTSVSPSTSARTR